MITDVQEYVCTNMYRQLSIVCPILVNIGKRRSLETGEYRDKISDQRLHATYPINRATFSNK